MCSGMSKTEKGIVGKINDFADTMVGQAKTVFGNDSAIFNTLKTAYDHMVSAGPSQRGFSQAERNAIDSSVVTNDAHAARMASASAGLKASEFGRGNEALTSGALNGMNANIAQESAEQTARDLNLVERADWETGRDNFFKSAAAESQLPNIYDNMSSFDANAQTALKSSYTAQANRDNAGGGWKNAVMSLAEAGINMVAPGVGTAIGGAVNQKPISPYLDPPQGGQGQGGQGQAPGGGGDGGNFINNGLANLDQTGGSSPWEQIKNFGAGMSGKTTG